MFFLECLILRCGSDRPVFDDLHPPTTSVAFTPASPDRWLQEATVLNEYKKSQGEKKKVSFPLVFF